ncbi:MAG: DUF11 domain-containing protein [bacterium]
MNLSKYLRAAALMACCVLPATTWAQRVAVMGANDQAWNQEVRDKIAATGLFEAVDAVDLNSTIPSLAELQNYCAVLAYTDDDSLDNDLLGDNLADYVDGGGGVVAAVFATASAPWAGRFDTENYWAIQPTGQQQDSQETLGQVFVPEHPILNGVMSFDGGTSSYRPSDNSLHPEATRIANWTGGDDIPLIATRLINGTRRADLGFYPPSTDSRDDFWVATTDGARIMANALLWTCQLEVDLKIVKTASVNTVRVGDSLVYTLAISNSGDNAATEVSVVDELPAGVELVSAEPAAACSSAGSTVTCDLGDLGVGASANISLKVRVLPQPDGSITNQATVSASEEESNPDDNASSVTVRVSTLVPPPRVDLRGGGCALAPWLGGSGMTAWAWLTLLFPLALRRLRK